MLYEHYFEFQFSRLPLELRTTAPAIFVKTEFHCRTSINEEIASSFRSFCFKENFMFKKLTCAAVLCAAALCGSATADEEGFVSLFNGQNLDGWTVRGGSATYQAEDGCIVGTCTPDTPHNTFLCTEKDYATQRCTYFG